MSGLSKENIKEDVSICFVRALAAQSGMSYDTPGRDNDSVDARISYTGDAKGWIWSSPMLDIQLKATSSPKLDKHGDFVFQLPIKNFMDLSRRTQVPRILVLLVLNHKSDFVRLLSNNMLIDGIAYWMSLSNYQTKSKAKKKISIKIPKKNKLTLQTVVHMINNIGCDKDVTAGLQ